MKKETTMRMIIYAAGLITLALGLVLNTKAGLGVSPIISVAYFASLVLDMKFADTTLFWYCVLVLIQMTLYAVRKKEKPVFVAVLLQIPFSIVFTRFMNLFSIWIPDCAADCQGTFFGTLAGQMLVLLLALLCTGVGAAMTLSMRLIVNPGDGIVQSVADFTGKKVGFTKNCIDFTCFLLTSCLSFFTFGSIRGIGIGTVIAVIMVGRVMAVFNMLFKDRLLCAAGLNQA